MSKAVKISHGTNGWGGPLVIQKEGKRDKILCVTGGEIPELAHVLADMTGGTIIDGFNHGCPDDEVMVAMIDCGGTARCGVYPRKKLYTINLTAIGPSGPLANFMTPDLYVSDVKIANLSYADGSEAPAVVKAETEGSAVAEATAQAAGAPKTKEQAKEEVAAMSEGQHRNIITRIGQAVGSVVNKFFEAGRDTINMMIRNVLPFMAFTATILGIISASGLGNVIANTIAPFAGSIPGMIIISLICAIPFISPILGPGAVIAQVVGVLLGQQFAAGSIQPQYALPALFAIDAQVGMDFIPVGLSLGEAEPETIEIGVPAILFSRVITGPVAVIIAFIFSFGLYT